MAWIAALEAEECLDPARVGGKASGLARLVAAGHPVPRGFAVTTDALRRFIEHHGLQGGAGAGERSRTLLQGAFPPGLEVALAQATARLGAQTLAIRSSAVGEDDAVRSMAGQLTTVLNVRPGEVGDAVRRCWAAAELERVAAYQRRHGLAGPPPVAVVVQRQIAPRWAGVLYTVDPARRVADEVVVEWVEGLGEELASGTVTPARVRAPRRTGAIDDPSLPEELRRRLEELVRLALDVERGAGHPVDVEWAIDDEGVHLLQARPITALVGPETVLWSSANVAENFPEPVVPIARSIIEGFYAAYMRQALRAVFGAPPGDSALAHEAARLIGFHRGRVFYALNGWYRLADRLPFAEPLKRFFDHYIGQNVPLRPAAGRTRGRSGARAAARLLLRGAVGILTLDGAMARFERRFEEARSRGRAARFDDASLPALLDQLSAARRIVEDDWGAPALADFAAMVFPAVLSRLCETWLRERDGGLLPRLLQGLNVRSAEPSALIEEIASALEPEPGARAHLLARRYAELEASLPPEAERPFREYLRRFGGRCYHEAMISSPTFEERTDLLWDLVRGHLELRRAGTDRRGTGPAEDRLAATASCLERLSWARRLAFRAALVLAQRAVAARERGRLCQSLHFGELRRVIVAIGGRLASLRLVDSPDDVLFLELEEVERLASGRLWGGASLRQLVRLRRETHAAHARASLPEFVALEPGEAMPEAAAPDAGTSRGGALRGIGVARGRREGRARVLLDPATAAPLSPGEIVIARATDPGWSPLFAIAGGVVVERGGLLSHASIIAREFGIPALVAEGATRFVADGQWVCVDADAGELRILEGGSP